MAKKRITRKQLLKGHDEFISFSAKAANYIRGHSQQFSYLGIGIIALFLIYIGVNTYMGYVNRKGQEAYNEAYTQFAKNLSPNRSQKDLKQSEELFQRVIDDYGLSKASRLALPQLAHIKFLGKKYEEAISLYKEFLAEVPENTPYQSLAQMALAASYEAKGEPKVAIETLERIVADSDNFFKEQAMFNLARVYRLTNQHDKSKEILKEFVEKFATSPFLPAAKAHLN